MTNVCSACHSTESVMPCPVCKVYSFCPGCRVSEDHTGTFRCKTCEKDICNTYQMGPTEEPECWDCIASKRSKILKDLMSTLDQECVDLLQDTIDNVDDMIKHIQKSIPNN